MANIKIEVDFSGLDALDKKIKKAMTEKLHKATSNLAKEGLKRAKEMADADMNSRAEKYKKALKLEEVRKGVWVISLDDSANWIEDGMPAHSMMEDLLKNAKVSKDGVRYQVIPFKHNPKPKAASSFQKTIIKEIKQELRAQKVPYAKIERDSSGSPKLGLLHSFNFDGPSPVERSSISKHPGNKKIEDFRGHTGTPYLNGLRIYQREVRDEKGNVKMNKKGQAMVQKDIMTFRTVSDKQAGKGMWEHPGIEGANILKELTEWMDERLEKEIIPEILSTL